MHLLVLREQCLQIEARSRVHLLHDRVVFGRGDGYKHIDHKVTRVSVLEVAEHALHRRTKDAEFDTALTLQERWRKGDQWRERSACVFCVGVVLVSAAAYRDGSKHSAQVLRCLWDVDLQVIHELLQCK